MQNNKGGGYQMKNFCVFLVAAIFVTSIWILSAKAADPVEM